MVAPPPSTGLEDLRREAAACQACPLWETGTQTVFGTGPATARLVLIGEAPGYQEDRQGVPFVGPAGRLLDEAMTAAGLDRASVYITNVVKHRPFTPGGRQGKNRQPKQSEVNACRPWLAGELAALRPQVVGCLGALAAKWVLGRDFRLMEQRGQWLTADVAPHVLATVHPSFVLIQPPESATRWRETLVADLQLLVEKLRSLDV